MTNLGQLRTGLPIERAIREIRDWLSKIGVSGLSIDSRYDARTNTMLGLKSKQRGDFKNARIHL